MNVTRWIAVAGLCVVIGSAVARANDAKAAPAATTNSVAVAQPDLAAIQRQIADARQAVEAQLKEIQQRLDSMSKFLGDKQATSFDTVDRRLTDLKRDLDDVKRQTERQR